MTILPTKPSELIRVALQDLEACEANSIYRINMGRWHGPEEGHPGCAICFAGAVMAQSLGADPEKVSRPSGFGTITQNALYALNFFREGCIKAGLTTLGLPVVMGDRELSYYRGDSVSFQEQMNTLANDFEELGL